MCNRKPLGRCASAIESTRASLILKESEAVSNIIYLKQNNADTALLTQAEEKLSRIKKDQLKNEIDFYASQEGQEKFRNFIDARELNKQENENRILGISRKTWQVTFSKKLFDIENSLLDKAEAVHYASNAAKLMLSSLDYEHTAKLALIARSQETLKNPQLNSLHKQSITEKIHRLTNELLVTELNISDTKAYLNSANKKFNSLIQGFIYTEPQHMQFS
jgi:hypothetical protein